MIEIKETHEARVKEQKEMMRKIKMKQLKDKEHIEAKITITKIREEFKEGNITKYKDKSIGVKVKSLMGWSYASFKDNKKGGKELLKFIKEELYLK